MMWRPLLSLSLVILFPASSFALSGSKLTGSCGSTAGLSGSTCSLVFDGDVNTFFDNASPDGGIVALSLDAPATVTGVRFQARPSWSVRMAYGEIEAQKTADGSWVSVHTISGDPGESAVDVSLTIPFNVSAVRYVAPNGGWGNIAELEVWGTSIDAEEQWRVNVQFLLQAVAVAVSWAAGCQSLKFFIYAKNHKDFW